jgi:hypothetical protein
VWSLISLWVDDLGFEAHGVEGVEDGDRVGQFVADRVRISPERVERGVFDAVPERLMLACQPGRIRGAGSAGDDIGQPCPEPAVLISGQVHHRRQGTIGGVSARSPDVLVDAECAHAGEPVALAGPPAGFPADGVP